MTKRLQVEKYEIVAVLEKDGVTPKNGEMHESFIGELVHSYWVQEGNSAILPFVYNTRSIHTSTVNSVDIEGEIVTIVTRNTIYKLERKEDN